MVDGLFAWVGTWNWGSIPEWGAAIGTVGAVIVSLWVVTGDRTRQKASDARLVTITRSYESQRFSGRVSRVDLKVSVRNSAPRTIVSAFVESPTTAKSIFRYDVKVDGRPDGEIRPGEEGHVKLLDDNKLDAKSTFMFFVDSDGNWWARRINDLVLFNGDRAHRIVDPSSYPGLVERVKAQVDHMRWKLRRRREIKQASAELSED